MPSLKYIIIYLVAVNVLTFAAYGLDKRAARNGSWRIAEKNLLVLALLGGTPMAFFASYKFRHKNKKQSFKLKMALILVTQLAAIAYLCS